MTIGAAWISKSNDGEELWIASDSRLAGDGNVWDGCPKLMSLPRRDAVAGFSGSTAQAYPLLLQLSNAISSYRPAADGTLEFLDLLGHLERVVNAMMSRIQPDPAIIGSQADYLEFATYNDALVIGGYSRAQNAMVLRRLRYSNPPGRWNFGRVRPRGFFGPSRAIADFGDARSRHRFIYLLHQYLQDQGTLEQDVSFKLEPLAIIAAMLRMPESPAKRLPPGRRPPTIGGAPQVLQVYSGGIATPLAVQWTVDGRSSIYLQGRETFGYEHLNVPLITFNDLRVEIHAPEQWPEGIVRNYTQPAENAATVDPDGS